MRYVILVAILLLGTSMAEARGGHGGGGRGGHGHAHGGKTGGHGGHRYGTPPSTERDQKPTIQYGYIDPRAQRAS